MLAKWRFPPYTNRRMPPFIPMRRQSLALSIALFAAGCQTSAANAPPPAPPPPAVRVVPAALREIRPAEELSGKIEAIQHVDIRPRVSGYITAIRYREGSEVPAGTVLFT